MNGATGVSAFKNQLINFKCMHCRSAPRSRGCGCGCWCFVYYAARCMRRSVPLGLEAGAARVVRAPFFLGLPVDALHCLREKWSVNNLLRNLYRWQHRQHRQQHLRQPYPRTRSRPGCRRLFNDFICGVTAENPADRVNEQSSPGTAPNWYGHNKPKNLRT